MSENSNMNTTGFGLRTICVSKCRIGIGLGPQEKWQNEKCHLKHGSNS